MLRQATDNALQYMIINVLVGDNKESITRMIGSNPIVERIIEDGRRD